MINGLLIDRATLFISIFSFLKFKATIGKNLTKKPAVFIMDFQSLYKLLLHQNYFCSPYFGD